MRGGGRESRWGKVVCGVADGRQACGWSAGQQQRFKKGTGERRDANSQPPLQRGAIVAPLSSPLPPLFAVICGSLMRLSMRQHRSAGAGAAAEGHRVGDTRKHTHAAFRGVFFPKDQCPLISQVSWNAFCHIFHPVLTHCDTHTHMNTHTCTQRLSLTSSHLIPLPLFDKVKAAWIRPISC